MNQRTCGGTEHLTATLQNSGLSQDYRAIVYELSRVDGLTRIWLVGYSLGGNLVLKAVGEADSSEPPWRRDRSLLHHRSDAMRQRLGGASELDRSLSLFDSTQTAYATESEVLPRQVGSHWTGRHSHPQ